MSFSETQRKSRPDPTYCNASLSDVSANSSAGVITAGVRGPQGPPGLPGAPGRDGLPGLPGNGHLDA